MGIYLKYISIILNYRGYWLNQTVKFIKRTNQNFKVDTIMFIHTYNVIEYILSKAHNASSMFPGNVTFISSLNAPCDDRALIRSFFYK